MTGIIPEVLGKTLRHTIISPLHLFSRNNHLSAGGPKRRRHFPPTRICKPTTQNHRYGHPSIAFKNSSFDMPWTGHHGRLPLSLQTISVPSWTTSRTGKLNNIFHPEVPIKVLLSSAPGSIECYFHQRCSCTCALALFPPCSKFVKSNQLPTSLEETFECRNFRYVSTCLLSVFVIPLYQRVITVTIGIITSTSIPSRQGSTL